MQIQISIKYCPFRTQENAQKTENVRFWDSPLPKMIWGHKVKLDKIS